MINLLVNEMDRRFDQKTLSILQEMEKLLVELCNGIKTHMSTEFTFMYQNDNATGSCCSSK